MPRPTVRVLALLEILQSGGTRTVAELAGRLDVDERTVRRYVEHLVELDIPVRSVRGRYGGYRIASGFRMPPLMLTDDEAVAVLVGLAVGQRAGWVPASGESATAKIRRVLPRPLARRLETLLASTDFTGPTRDAVNLDSTVLLTFAEAAHDHRPVAIRYVGRDGGRSERVVRPYGIVAHSGRWYLSGADSASDDVRTFRLDRVERAALTTGTFEVPESFDPTQRVLTGLAEQPWRHEVSVRVEGRSAEIRARLPAGLAVVEESPDDGWVRVRMRVERLDWVPAVLASLDRPMVVENPDELRDHVQALARRLRDACR